VEVAVPDEKPPLLARDELYRSIIDNTRDVIVVVTPDGKPVYVSPSSQALLGYAPEEILDGKALDLVHDDDRARAVAAFRASRRARDTRSIELRCRHRDGEWRIFDCVGNWILDGTIPQRAVLVFRDISKRKRAEHKLQQANTQLENRERDLVAALASLRLSHEQLQAAHLRLIDAARMESVGRLAAGVAHEVKNPLTVILMGLEYLGKRLRDTDADVHEVMTDMEEAVARANTVVRGLLDFSTPNSLELESVALNEVIEKAIALTKHEFARAKVVVECDLAADLPPVRLDRGKMEQVFVNVFLNAAQAMPEGGTIRVRTRRDAGTATAPAVANPPAVVAEVVDSGDGIPAATLERVFDPFFTTKPAGEGTGLGLTVIRRIIELHGAAIRLANEPGGGLCVTLRFETAEAAS
jgi:PAS domain S-box-containing protein